MVAAPEHEHCVHAPRSVGWVRLGDETKTVLAQFEYRNTRQTLLWRHGVQVVQYVYRINSFNCIVTYHG